MAGDSTRRHDVYEPLNRSGDDHESPPRRRFHLTGATKSRTRPLVSEREAESPVPGVKAPKAWNIKLFSRPVLVALLLVYASILAALAVLYQYFQTHHGLVAASSYANYLWTYIATAVFIEIAT